MSWVDRAAACAKSMLAGPLHGLAPERDPDGVSPNHLRWMAEELAAKRLASETKACRWLGYLQCALVMNGVSSLAEEKARNLESRNAVA